MELIEDQSDDAGRNEIVESGGDAWVETPAWRRPAFIAVAAVAVASIAGWAWMSGREPARVAVAVQSSAMDAARASLASQGIAFEHRDGALWVAPADARRAAEAAAPRPQSNAVADALEGESVFASGETSRARRTAATIRELESAISMQPGVARASVVIGESQRAFAPGASAGGSASVTVSMRSGPMPQELVDAVGVLVAGACPGMRPESVAVIDAGVGRVRSVRGAAERAGADAARAREEGAERIVASLVSDIPGARVEVREAEGGAVLATVILPRSFATARAEFETGGDVSRYLELERDRIGLRVEPFLAGPNSCATAVAVALAPESSAEYAMAATPESPYSSSSPATASAQAAAERERVMPLGSGNADSFPAEWVLVVVAGGAALAWWAWRRPSASRIAGETAEVEVPDFEAEPLPGADASDAVREMPERAAEVLGSWIAGGEHETAARLVVALDASAAASVLQSLPVEQVQRVTAALGALDAPSHEELAEAVRGFLDELHHGPVPGYRGASEAA